MTMWREDGYYIAKTKRQLSLLRLSPNVERSWCSARTLWKSYNGCLSDKMLLPASVALVMSITRSSW